MSAHPRTSELIERIRRRDGQVGVNLGNAPEEWVKLARDLEGELAAVVKQQDNARSVILIARDGLDTAESSIDKDQFPLEAQEVIAAHKAVTRFMLNTLAR